jgi:hypothetical protein
LPVPTSDRLPLLCSSLDPLALIRQVPLRLICLACLAWLRSSLQGSSLLRVFPLPALYPYSRTQRLWAFCFQSFTARELVTISGSFLSCRFWKLALPRGFRGFFLPESCLLISGVFHLEISTNSLSFCFLKLSPCTWQPRSSALFPSCSYPSN